MDNNQQIANQQLRLKQEETVWLQYQFTKLKLQALLDYRQKLLLTAMKQNTDTEVGCSVALRILTEASTITQTVKLLDPNYSDPTYE